MSQKYVRKSNLDALKKAFETQKRGGGDFRFWKPIKYGKYTVRFLPPHDSDGLFFKETAQHKIGDNYYFCPKSEGDHCPICEKYKKLYDIGTDDAVALAKEIKPRKQYLYNIIVKEELGEAYEDNTKVFVYMSGKMLYDALMDYFFDEDYGDLTDVESGYDFVINKEHGDLGFPSYKKSKPRRNSSVMLEDDDDIEKVLEGIKDLNKEIELKSYDELKEALGHFLTEEKEGGSKFADKISKKEKSVDKDKDEDEDEVDDDDLEEFEKTLLKGLD